MPATTVSTNASLLQEQKVALAGAVSQLFVDSLKTSARHNHVRIVDNEFISFGGDDASPAALVVVKAADNSISKEAREALVVGFSTALPAHIPCLNGERVWITFEELPVQNIAVGNSIASFSTMHTAKSVEHISEVQP